MAEQYTDTSNFDNKEQDSRKVIVIVVISILLGVNGLLLWQFFDKKTHLEEVNKTLDSTIAERDAISSELKKMKDDYEKINQENAGLQSQLSTKDEEIKSKIAEIQRLVNSGDAAQLKKAREELNQLRAMNQNYVVQVDSLKKVTEDLNKQNLSLNETLTTEKVKVESLTQENSLLANKVAVGSVLRTMDVSSIGVRYKSNGKESEMNKASKVQKIKTCFTVLDNSVADKGSKDVFIRVISPDGSVLATTQETFMYNNTATLYTVKDSFDYNNEKTKVCVYFDKGSGYSKGKYSIELYSGGSQIGSTSLVLK
jgi:predicted nuclease with TOPRIM domain